MKGKAKGRGLGVGKKGGRGKGKGKGKGRGKGKSSRAAGDADEGGSIGVDKEFDDLFDDRFDDFDEVVGASPRLLAQTSPGILSVGAAAIIGLSEILGLRD